MTVGKSLIGALKIPALWLGMLGLLYLIAGIVENYFPPLESIPAMLTALFFLATPLFLLVFILVRLVQKRFIEAGVILLFPFLLVALVLFGGDYLRRGAFRAHKAEYLAVISAEPSLGPKFHVFDLGVTGPGFGNINFEAIVYDETDEIARDPSARSSEWIAHRSNPAPGTRWVSDHPLPHARCTRTIKSFGEHFYYVEDAC